MFLLTLCPNKTTNCKTFKKSCDSCNQYPECVCQWPNYFSLILFFKIQNLHLHEHKVFISYLYFPLAPCSRCVERLMEISSNYALSGLSAASSNLMKVTQKLMGELMTQLSSNQSSQDQFET